MRAIGERGDIIRTLQRELSARIAGGEVIEHEIFRPEEAPPPLVGRVVRRGLADELGDRHFLIVDGVDGQTHYVAIGKGELVEPTPEGHVVRITARNADLRAVDRTVIEVAAANGGIYSAALHRAHDSAARPDFIDAHVRRLEAIRRSTPGFEREGDGTWQLGDDHEGRVLRHEQRQLHDRPVEVSIVADRPLPDLARHEGASWLDRDLAGAEPVAAREAGFGREVRAALALRRQWLVDRGFADEGAGGWRYRPAALSELARRDLRAAALGLQKATGLAYRETEIGDRIEGVVRRRVDLVSGRFALLERAHDFSLVPWRPVFARQIGKHASGIMRGGAIHWTFGRGRAGPHIE